VCKDCRQRWHERWASHAHVASLLFTIVDRICPAHPRLRWLHSRKTPFPPPTTRVQRSIRLRRVYKCKGNRQSKRGVRSQFLLPPPKLNSNPHSYETISDLMNLQDQVESFQKLIFAHFQHSVNNEYCISALVPLVKESNHTISTDSSRRCSVRSTVRRVMGMPSSHCGRGTTGNTTTYASSTLSARSSSISRGSSTSRSSVQTHRICWTTGRRPSCPSGRRWRQRQRHQRRRPSRRHRSRMQR